MKTKANSNKGDSTGRSKGSKIANSSASSESGSTSSASGRRKLVIVESPTKAKTIRKFLGKDYIVESCMGHIRDLPQSAKDIPEKVKKEPWATLGVNVEKKFEPLYCVPKDKLKVVKTLKEKLDSAEELYLATDEDREGESISWHLTEVLKPKVPTKRMVFHEITKTAIEKSLKETRVIDLNLVRAQEARRILDRLVGYSISPLLWKKVAYGLSAGRVQSVAVRLIAEKELERMRFKKAQYWGVAAQLEKDDIQFEAKIHSLGSMRIATGKDFDGKTGLLSDPKTYQVLDQDAAEKLIKKIQSKKFEISEVEEKPVARRPSAPFITSTLQQESNRKLGLSSRETMQVAQKLYEQGFITYMRTDSTFLSQEAITAARDCIGSKYGKEYLPNQPRVFDQKKVKGAQEAHEAIRPAGNSFVDPDETGLVGNQFKLYDLIWKRTVASQMVDARQKQVSVRLKVEDALFAASGMTIEFPGFLRAYVEGSDDPDADLQEREVRLPALKLKDQVQSKLIEPTSHETKPPARFTEASLVQTMEKEGIGRPSTYASIIGTIIDRGYVRRNGTALAPTFTALVVSKLLSQFLPQYVDLHFTSEMEKSLDTIAEGDLDSEDYLEKIYFGKAGLKSMIESQEKKIDPEEARSISFDRLKGFEFRVGKYGAYVCTKRDGEEVRASVPDNESPSDIQSEDINKWIEQKINGADSIGKDPATDLPIFVLSGRFGPYVQLGEINSDADKPKRISLPIEVTPETITLQQAIFLVSLPKVLGKAANGTSDIKLGIGRFGPYVVCDGDFRSIPRGESLFSVTHERGLELLATPKKGRGRAAPLKDLGIYEPTGAPIHLMNGPYGLYVKSGKINASIPEGETAETMDLAKAIEVLNAKGGAKTKAKAAKGTATKKASTEKAATKKAATEKSAEAKVAAKQTAKGAAKSTTKASPKVAKARGAAPSVKSSKSAEAESAKKAKTKLKKSAS